MSCDQDTFLTFAKMHFAVFLDFRRIILSCCTLRYWPTYL